MGSAGKGRDLQPQAFESGYLCKFHTPVRGVLGVPRHFILLTQSCPAGQERYRTIMAAYVVSHIHKMFH
jgi:hypothetical protein